MLETAEQEIDNSIIQSPEDHCVDQQANMLGWSTTTGKSASSRYFNLPNLRATNGLSVGSVRSKDSQMRQPWRNSPPANERSWSGESSLNHYTLNGCARNSPTKPFDAMSLTPPASPELMKQSAAAADTGINTYPSRLGAHKHRRFLRNDGLSQASEPVFFDLDHGHGFVLETAA